jgi:hypothetical protein
MLRWMALLTTATTPRTLALPLSPRRKPSARRPGMAAQTPKELDQYDSLKDRCAASNRGLMSRYWDTPSWPISTQGYVQQILVDSGIGRFDVDGMVSVSAWTRIGVLLREIAVLVFVYLEVPGHRLCRTSMSTEFKML